MTSELQREALAVLAEVWAMSPDVRLGQLFAHLGFLGEAHLGRGLSYLDDDEMVAILYRHKAELVAQLEDAPDAVMQRTGDTSISGSPTFKDTSLVPERGR